MESKGSLSQSQVLATSPSWAKAKQSMPPHPTSWRSILILSFHLHLGLPSGHFPWELPTKILYTPLLSPIQAAHPVDRFLFELITQIIWWGVQSLKLLSSSSSSSWLSRRYRNIVWQTQMDQTTHDLTVTLDLTLHICTWFFWYPWMMYI